MIKPFENDRGKKISFKHGRYGKEVDKDCSEKLRANDNGGKTFKFTWKKL